ncbi:nucleolar protein 10-like [Salvia splendens]|uniref:nucleolar protein 10-like n=1 Tax=Salvia splendens TaxID=180675 RepID=UPI001C272A29|nr:nucleolar protein 10-like [Salvia splendens]XP_042060686.1 nucleolar protein 10-like [Salvia splendens]XP_042060687.1 nucleolar protein 10-like [Salvia splendens]
MAFEGGTLKSSSINGVKMYSVSGQNRSLAAWLPPKKLRALRKNPDYLQRVDLVQDLRFETSTSRIKVTPDGEYLVASGIYPPQVKVYELRELSLKFERHLVSEIVDFEILDDDYSKMAFLCTDRSIRLHAKYGSHYSLRIPRMGRDIVYDGWSCDIICAASSPDLYRINLEQGRFLASLSTQSPALNVVSRSKIHGLVAGGGEDGAVECFDMRTKSSVGRLDAVASAGDNNAEVTAIEFDGDGGYQMAVGSSAGKILIYDLRSSNPMRIKDHMYGSPILNIKWHKTLNSEQSKLITTDKHIVRIWDPETGEGMTSIEPSAGKINDICIFKDSGLILLALDSSQIPSFFIPALGPAPKWCSYLENLTEELEEGGQTTIYDDYKFLTKEDLAKLNLTNLIGTNLLRAYMHGYFVDYRLYKKAQSLAEPFAYESYIEKRKQEKSQSERENRITIKRKLPKVNRTLAARLLDAEKEQNDDKDADVAETQEKTGAKKGPKRKRGLTTEVLKDERFTSMFEDEDFEVDEFSKEYLALHPMPATTNKPSLLEEHFEALSEDEQSISGTDVPSEDDLENTDGKSKRKSQVPRFYEVKDNRHAEAFWNDESLADEESLPMGERAAQTKPQQGSKDVVKYGQGGSREISFKARSSAKAKEYDDIEEAHPEKRRGVQSLKLPGGSGRGSHGRGGGFRGRGGGSRGRGGGSRGRGGGRGRSSRGRGH